MKFINNKLLFISILLLSSLIKTIFFNPNIASSIILLGLIASYTFIYYLLDKSKPDPHAELKQQVERLKDEVNKFNMAAVRPQSKNNIGTRF